MHKKYFFFDIDMTLCNEKFEVPLSTIETLKELKNKGHEICLCTGRARYSMLKYAKFFDVDHYVCSEGNSAYYYGKRIFSNPMDEAFLNELIETCDEHFIPVGMICDETNAVTRLNNKVRSFKNELNLGTYILAPKFHLDHEVYKAYVYCDGTKKDKLELFLEKYPHYTFGDGVAFAKREKEKGIESLIKKLGAKKEDIVVFGDSANDITMFQYADVAIAMGNAIDDVKELASYVTKHIDEDGIMHACKYYGWID